MNNTRRFEWLLATALIVAAMAAYTWGTWRYFTSRFPGGNDFLARYTAWEAYFRYGLNPYSDEAADYTNRAVYGRPARPGEDENRLTYPFYSVLVHGPFTVLDYAVARAVFMTLLQAALFGGVMLTLDLLRWRPPVWVLGFLLGWALLHYHQARGVILGQFAVLAFGALAATLWLLRARRDGAAGALLVVTTIKPTLVFLVIPFLVMWAVTRRRWRFVAGFGLTIGLLTAASLAALPTWVGDWLSQMALYPNYTVGQSPVWLLTHDLLPGLGGVGEVALTAGMLAALLGVWWPSLRATAPAGEFHWALGMTLVVSNLIVPRSATTNYVLMLIPTLWVFAAADRAAQHSRAADCGAEYADSRAAAHGQAAEDTRRNTEDEGRPAPRGRVWSLGRPAWMATALISLIGHWWLHYATVVGNQEQPALYWPWPLALGAVLLLGRRWLLRDAAEARLWPARHEPAVAAAARTLAGAAGGGRE